MKRVKQIVMMAFASLLAQCVWAAVPTPVAHWTNLSEGAKGGEEGTDGAKFTLNAGTGCTFSEGKASITKTSGASNTGLLVNWNSGDAGQANLTVVVKYSGYSTENGNNCLLATLWGTNELVAYANGSGSNVGLSANVTANNGGTQNMTSPSYAVPKAGYIMMTMSTAGSYGTSLSFKPEGNTLYRQVAYQSGHRYGSQNFNQIKIGGTQAGNTKYYRPALTIEEVTIYTAKVTAADINADIIANFPEVSFTKANDTDWASKTMPTKANTAAVTANTSFAGNGDYIQTLGNKESTVVNVTSANSNIIYGLHAMNGNQNGLGNTTRDIYLKTSGGTFNAITGGEDATWNGTKTVLTGDTLVNIAGSTVVDYVYGAGMGGGSNVTTTGNTGVVIEGDAQVKGTIAGGWQSRHDSYPKITGNSTVLVKNVQTNGPNTTTSTGNHTVDKGLIVGGSIYWGNGGAGTIEGNSAVVVDIASGTATSTFAKKIVGGSYHKNDRKEMTVKGNSSVTITAPDTVTFNQEIIGGGHSTGSQSKVEGNSSVTINGGTYTANIYAGGNHNSAPVTGTATLTINGGVFSGAHLNAGTATGKKILNFNCDQEFAWANIAGFDEISIADTKKLTMSVTASDPRDLTCSFTGAGTLEKTGSGTLRAIGGKEGKIVVKGGTFCIKLSAEQQVAGYTAQATIDGGTLKFLGLDNTELENESEDPTVYKMPKNAWNDTGDHNWDNTANWSYGTVPTADEIIELSTEGTIKVSSTSTCQQLVVNANVTLEGQIGAGKLPNIVIADGKALTINATSDSTINGISGGTLIKDGTATLSAKVGSGTDTAPLHNMAVIIKNGKLMIDQPTGTEATIHDVAFTIEETACGEDKVPLDNYGWFSATGPWSIETTGHARVFNNNNNNTSVIKGGGAFTKLGTGKVTILSSLGNSGNAYTGNVTVSAGELVLQPSGNGQCPNMTGTTTVNADATLTAKISSTAAANLKLVNNGTFNVDQGSVNMTAASDQSVKGTVNIAQGATLTNASNDAIAYGGSTTVNVRGTLAMGNTRWTVGGTSTINLYGGCTVTGSKTGAGSFDLYRSNEVLKVLKGSDESNTAVTIDAKIRTRNDNAKISIADGMTLAISGGIGMNAGEGNVVSIVGGGKLTGQLDISGIELNLGKTKNQEVQLVCSSDTTTIKLEGDNSDSIASDTKTSPFITVNSGATLNLAYNNFAGWNGGLDNGYVVNNGTLKITNLADSSGFFRNHLILGDGVTTELNNTYSSMIIYGGAATEETAQIQLASGSATIASTVDNAKGISLSNDYNGGGFGTKGAGVTVGTDAVLTISTLFKGSEALTKYGAGKLVLSNASNTYTGSVNLKAGTIQSAKALTVATDVSGMMVVGNGSEATPYALAAVVAKIGDTPYASVEDAIAHLGEGQTITLVDTTAELPAGWTTVTKDGVVTIRQKGDIYYVSGYMGTSEAALVVQAANGGTTSLLDGDTLVIGTPATVAAAWMANDFAIKTFKIEKDFTLHAGTVDAILDNATVTVAEGKTLTLNNSGSEKAITLGTVTLNGAILIADATKATAITATEINGTCTITLGENASITIGTKAETVTIASGVEHKHVVQSGTTYSLAMDQVTISVPAIDNTTVAVTGGTLADNAVVVDYGTAVTVTYTANENYKLVGGDGVYTFDGTADGTAGEGLSAVLDVTTITIPEAPANTVVKVTVNGTEVTPEGGSITATIGATVVVTYSAAEGYIMADVVTEFTASTTAPTITVPTAAPVLAVAQVGTTLYPMLAAAFAVGGDVTLLQNTTETLTIVAGKSVTLDLNGKTITSAANTITVKGTLAVNGAAGGIASTGSGKSAITTSGSGTFTINGGTISAVGTAVSGVGTITGGTITSSGSFAVYANSSSGSIVITGGTITGAAAKGDVGVYTGNVKVTGATLANGIKFASNASGIILAGTDTELIPAEADVEVYNGETLEGYYFSASSNGLYTTTAGKVCKLAKDITHQIIIYANTTLDLNGHNITVTDKDTAILMKAGSSASAVRTATITGEGTVSCDNGSGCNAVQVQRYADLTIAGGSYYVGTDTVDTSAPDNATIYIVNSYKTAPTKVTITGGTFEAKGSGKYTLNILDSLLTGLSDGEIPTITVSGGTFKHFDPAANNDATVAAGYESVKDGDNYRVQVKLMPEEPTVDEKGDLVIPTPTGATTVEVSVEGEKISDGKIPLTDTGLYTVTAKDSNGIVVSESQLGVINVEKTSAATTHAVAVPFKGATVANLLNTALLSKDDQLKAVVNGAYMGWSLDSNKTWQPMNDSNGNPFADADKTALARGTAVWVTTADPIVTFGTYATEAVALPTTKDTAYILANPTMDAYTVPVAQAAKDDQVVLPGSSTRYTVIETAGGVKAWKCTKSVQNGTIPGTNIPAFSEVVTVAEEAPSIGVGKGFWFLKK